MNLSLDEERIAGLFDQLAETYDGPATRFFPFCADRMAYRFPPAQNSKVLDVATGTGALALSLAQAMGQQGEGRVTGIDISPGMLDVAYRNLRRLALKNVDLHEMSASHLEFRADYFDAVYCSFGLFYIEDMRAALVSWRRVTRAQGKLVFSSFAEDAFQPMAALLSARLEAQGIDIAKDGGYPWCRLAASDRCKQLLQASGWEQVEVHQEQCGYHMMALTDWWELVWNTDFRVYLEQLTEKALEQLKVAHLAELEPLTGDQGLWLDVPVNFVSAVNPG